jgi:hypothetical protein
MSKSEGSGTAGRLTWGPPSEGPHLAAVWWPRSRDATTELPELIESASAHMGGPVTRVSLNIDAWDLPQPKRMRITGRIVRVGWFHQINPATVTVGRGAYDRLTIAVLPSDLEALAAGNILRRLETVSPWPSTQPELVAAGETPHTEVHSA